MSASVSDSKEPFLQHPWTSSLLSQPNTTIRVPPSRVHKSNGEDTLFSTTLRTNGTLSSCLCIWPAPCPSDPAVPEITTLIYLGKELNGHPSILHGGITATIIDECMGFLQTANIEEERRKRGGEYEQLGSFTATLTVDYRKPIRTPGPVIVKSWYERRDGRKEWVNAEVQQEQDGKVVVVAEGAALFVTPRSAKM